MQAVYSKFGNEYIQSKQFSHKWPPVQYNM